MKKLITTLLFISVTSAALAQGSNPPPKQSSKRGEVAGYTSRDATVLSMMGWGVALAVGICTLCALIEKNAASGSSNNNH